ncbi:MAG: eukaryotic-like serine/threonine-protein kinase [Verrucomicrobiota bacterium]
MELSPPTDSTLGILAEPEICAECHCGSRLTNGLCLNCLLRGALDNEEAASGKEAFKEVLAAVKSRDGDWHIADHEIVNEIARGGMGVVYQAREPHSGRIVALKCVLAHQGDSDHALARFRREAETAARLDHPHIVPIYQVGETADGFPYYTMKYATEGSLLQARHPLLLHPRESVQLMTKVARAVHYAHEQGVLHRDLKPGNILLDSRREPLVSDFGLARCEATSSYLTRSMASFGTPGYIAPEQADGPAAQLTPAADIYSLGAILFELLTGRPPFVGDNAFAVMKQSAEKPAPKVRSLAPHADRDLETICARCLEREPADRYQSAASLADDLQSWLDDRPIAARRARPWVHSRRWIRHNRSLAAALGAFCILAVVAGGWKIHARNLQATMQESLLASRSIVVVPFLDLDKAAPDPAFAESLARSLQDQLGSLGPARVRTVGSGSGLDWARPEDIRKAVQQTGMRTMLSGTTRTVEGKSRISYRLMDAARGDVLFTDVWEANGIGNASNSVPASMAQAMYSVLSANDWSTLIESRKDPGLRNHDAKEAIDAGRSISVETPSGQDKAIKWFEKALQLEPNSFLAHAYYAIAASVRTHFTADRSFLERAKKEAQRAMELSPGSSDAHKALAGVYYQEGKFSEALYEQLRAIELGGLEAKVTRFIGQTLEMLGRLPEALNWYELASRQAGMPGEADSAIGDCWAKLCDDDQAIQSYNRSAELRPRSPEALVGLSYLRLLQNNAEAAREIFRSVQKDHGDLGETAKLGAQIEFFARNFKLAESLYGELATIDPDGGGSFYGSVTYESALARTKQALGDNESARVLLKACLEKETVAVDREPSNPEAIYRLAAVEALLGKSEASFSHLRKASQAGWLDYRSFQMDPRFDSLRQHPKFDTIVKELSAKVADMRLTAVTQRKK